MRIPAQDYPGLKAFFLWMCEFALPPAPGTPAGQRPAAILDLLENQSAAIARQGLAHGLADIVEGTHDVPPAQLQLIDAELSRLGIVTLSEVRARFWKKLAPMLKRGKLRDEGEYRALRSMVDALPESDQSKARTMLGAFEAQPALPLESRKSA